ncbi:leucine-rich repeat-containing protein 48 [Asbolus verrucosus]|uniref:Dynein axonemal assembly factor 1 homolog n=1 Tax=Asbolus verrucosus TaxID=1661398 RepID=A0A482VFC6_ASBVE|nr:leucine-rich repeat-containing protein 48 [Asbolus verrucosus]
MNTCKLHEPKVIDNALIEKCIKNQGPKGEAGRLAEMEGIHLEKVDQIRLEFEKQLTNLEILSFFDNEIETLENMDTLTKLTIFSIGRNKLTDLDNILYLRRFSNLKSLNLVGNPCAENEDFRLFVVVFLPQIVYYEYKLIHELERELGHETFSSKLRVLLEQEEKEAETRKIKAQEKADAELHALSFVEYLNSRHLFDALFEDDPDGKSFLDMGEEAMEFYDEYEEEFIELCKQIFHNGQNQYILRKNEYDQFLKCVEAAKKQNQEESIKHMEIFLGKKADLFYEIKNTQNMLNLNEITYEEFLDNCDVYVTRYNSMLHEIWKALMKLELELYEQMEEVNQNFDHGMTELVNNFIESSQAYFSQIRDLEMSYSDNIGQFAIAYQTNANVNEESEIPPALKYIMSDKDVLHNAIATSHDMHMQIIDSREDTLISKAEDWLEELVENLTKK